MRTKFTTFVIGSMLACSAHAANWYGFTVVGTDNAVYYFDLDTVTKDSTGVTIWIKYVNDENTPDQDGSYATTTKWRYECKRHALQALMQVTYDKNQNTMRTTTTPGKLQEPVPGTVGESSMKVICAPGFPSQKSDEYVKVADNDVYATTKRLMTLRNNPVPK